MYIEGGREKEWNGGMERESSKMKIALVILVRSGYFHERQLVIFANVAMFWLALVVLKPYFRTQVDQLTGIKQTVKTKDMSLHSVPPKFLENKDFPAILLFALA